MELHEQTSISTGERRNRESEKKVQQNWDGNLNLEKDRDTKPTCVDAVDHRLIS